MSSVRRSARREAAASALPGDAVVPQTPAGPPAVAVPAASLFSQGGFDWRRAMGVLGCGAAGARGRRGLVRRRPPPRARIRHGRCVGRGLARGEGAPAAGPRRATATPPRDRDRRPLLLHPIFVPCPGLPFLPDPLHKPAFMPHQSLNPLEVAELRAARERAAKAAEGRRAQLLAHRRAKRAAAGPVGAHKSPAGRRSASPEAANARASYTGPLESTYETDAELQARLAATTDEGEVKRLKRLLRNRVSAQQARERKRAAQDALARRADVADARAAAAEARVAALERESEMLRRVIQNMRSG